MQFYCQLDEDHFFEWLKQIDGVVEFRGNLTELMVSLSVSYLTEPALRDLIGLLYRYNLPMGALQSQLTPENEHWFKNREAYWYAAVFERGRTLHDQSLLLDIVWEDDYMIEIECAVRSGSWSAQSRAYAQRPQLAEFSTNLKEFAKRCEGAAVFQVGAANAGSIKLSFYSYDKSKHIACFVELSAAAATNFPRAEEISRSSFEVHTEASFVDLFTKSLDSVASGLHNEATLRLVL
jgi:hypothetical protein